MNNELIITKTKQFLNSIYLPIFISILTILSWKIDLLFLVGLISSITLLLTIILKTNTLNILIIIFSFFSGAKHENTNFFSLLAILTYIIGLIAIILLIREMIANKIKIKNILLYALFAWLASMVISLINTVSYTLTFSSILTLSGMIFIFIYMINRTKYTEENKKHIAKIMICISFIIISQMILRYFELYNPEDPFYIIKRKGLDLGWTISNRYACYLVFSVITTMYLYITSIKTKLVYGLIVIIQLLAILITLARGAYLGIAFFSIPLVFIVFYYSKNKKREIIYLTIFASVGIGALLVLTQLEVFEQFLEHFINIDYSNTSGREPLYEVGQNVFKENWLIGAGAGTSRYFISTVLGRTELNYHNIFLQALADQGIIGLITFVSVIVTSLIISFKKDLYKSLMICIILYLIGHGLVDTTFYSYSILPFFILLIGFSAAYKTE